MLAAAFRRCRGRSRWEQRACWAGRQITARGMRALSVALVESMDADYGVAPFSSATGQRSFRRVLGRRGGFSSEGQVAIAEERFIT